MLKLIHNLFQSDPDSESLGPVDNAGTATTQNSKPLSISTKATNIDVDGLDLLRDLQVQNEELRRQLSQKNKELLDAYQRADHLEKELKTFGSKIDAQQNQFTAKDSKLPIANREIDPSKKNMKEVKSKVMHANELCAVLETSFEGRDIEVEDVRAQVIRREEAASNPTDIIADLLKRIQELEHEII
ncbi:hypothetical protein BDZ45DRAFT_749587 [Acephala macrosclerotiorum]|nr:hypothetical protein BDZ45DRAFT_749587 [Acephala macrosclerotiorum]